MESRQTGRAELGLRIRARPARLAPRMLGDGASPAGRAADRHPLRRRRSHLPASRERDRAERRRDQQTVRPVLDARRTSPDRRREDVEVAWQRVQPARHSGEGISAVDAAIPAAVDPLSEAVEIQLGHDGSGRGGASAACGLRRAARSRLDRRIASGNRGKGGSGRVAVSRRDGAGSEYVGGARRRSSTSCVR